ncbi:MAG: hypothetical protein MUC69_07375 [Gemmatimonadales bacterium]|nr:hypothetical protein [Gemmatimonadales bacterium]
MAQVANGFVIPGLEFWIVCWYAILALGVIGLAGSLLWGPGLRWRNADEILRGIGTVVVSLGMLVVLHWGLVEVGEALLAAAVGIFASAYNVSQRVRPPRGAPLRLHLPGTLLGERPRLQTQVLAMSRRYGARGR